MPEEFESGPEASALIESMRDIGYTLETAVADIIDNSITARARRATIETCWAGADSWIAILDDGSGMDLDELKQAMRCGSKNPLDHREVNDLGRFGLGLKTASFSQCRKITVVSCKNGQLNACRWDLDLVASRNLWVIEILSEDEIESDYSDFILPSDGTAVIWEKMDRVIEEHANEKKSEDDFNRKIASLSDHLSLTFHRYLSSNQECPTISISVNGTRLYPFDPFNEQDLATQKLPDEALEVRGKKIRISPFILPHHSKVSVEAYERYSGREGYLKSQGFYVYRNHRLIISGTWFRLRPQNELTKLARVRIDIPNGLDHLWTIDVKKSRAKPPPAIRERLTKVIDQILKRGINVYRSRAELTQKAVNPQPCWIRTAGQGRISYNINIDHPLLRSVLDELSETGRANLRNAVRLIQENFPVDSFFSDFASRPRDFSADPNEGADSILDLAENFCETLEVDGWNTEELWQTLINTKPFSNHVEQISNWFNNREKTDV